MGELRTLSNGVIYDMDKKRIVGTPPGGPTTAIKTQAQAIAMVARKKEIAELAKLKGMILGAGLELPPDDDLAALIRAAGNAEVAYTAKLGQVYMQSDNLRGMAESIKYLRIGDDQADRQPMAQATEFVSALTDLLGEVKRVTFDNDNYQNHDAIDAQATDIDDQAGDDTTKPDEPQSTAPQKTHHDGYDDGDDV